MSRRGKEVWRRAEADSPCRNICVIDRHSRLCIGCYRTGEEIAAWSAMTPEARRALIAELPARAPQIAKRPRKGRAARLRERD